LLPKIKVLIVDDDAAVCLMLTLMLSAERCEVKTTRSIADALGVIEGNPFDVYVMDLELPDGGGLVLAELLRSNGSKAPIILISGYEPSAAELRVENLQIFGYLQKPFSRAMFCSVMKKAIGSLQTVAPDLEVGKNLWRF
jgi:CheY-like chemotaxis protein